MHRPAEPASQRSRARGDLVVVGLDHTMATIGLRERLSFAAAELPAVLQSLVSATDLDRAMFEQVAILSTCNRVEFYGVAGERTGPDQVAAFLSRHRGVDHSSIAEALYAGRGKQAAHHLAATAAGMRSLVLGEAQIQGQVRDALAIAVTAGTAGTELRRLFEAAITAGRRVRARTALGCGVASVPHAGVELVRMRLGTLEGTTVLLIGAGAVSELAAKHLKARGARELFVMGRDPARAQWLAERHGGRSLDRSELDDALAWADVVVSSTGAPHAILRPVQVRQALARRSAAGPLILLDLAVPRDVDPAVAELAGVEVYGIDDLERVGADTLARRRQELPAANAILHGEITRFMRWLSSRHANSDLRDAGRGSAMPRIHAWEALTPSPAPAP